MTGEPQRLAQAAAVGWELPFEVVGDPHHEIRTTCRERGWIEVFANKRPRFQRQRRTASHPNGYFQPSVVAIANNRSVLYRWRCRPTRRNRGGAGTRPAPERVWAAITSRVGAGDRAPIDPDPPLDTWSGADRRSMPWPAFVLAMLANGWFLRPRLFTLATPHDTQPAPDPAAMGPRVAAFGGIWLVAAAVLPRRWVGAALAFYAAVVAPGIVEAYREFQHEPDNDREPTGATGRSA